MFTSFSSILENFFASIEGLRHGATPRVRTLSAAERKLISETKRQGILREIANPTATAHADEERQLSAYWGLWRSIKSATMGPIPPETLDRRVPEHVALALGVVGDYDAAREQPGEFSDCLYRPASSLPYPPPVIRRCCEFLISIADSSTDMADNTILKNERDTLGLALFSLDYFLDLPAEKIPHRKLENLACGSDHAARPSTPVVTPHPGDAIVRAGYDELDYVNQVIGVNAKDEWMVLTQSGAPVQITRSPASGNWEEVVVIAAAAADWLMLTPPSGTPKVEH